MTATQQTIDDVTRRLVETFHPEKIILFGSYAWGTPTEDSDLDVLVILRESNEPAHRRAAHAYRALQGLRFPVDVLVRTQDEVMREFGLRASLLNKILTEGRMLHG